MQWLTQAQQENRNGTDYAAASEVDAPYGIRDEARDRTMQLQQDSEIDEVVRFVDVEVCVRRLQTCCES